MDLIPLFLGPKVTSFTFRHLLCEHNSNPALLDQYTLPHLYTMVAICPTLTQLELHMKKHNVALANAAAAFAYDTYPRLECFVVEGVDPWPEHFLQYLAGLPYLRRVHLTLDDVSANNMGIFYTATPHFPFPSLHTLQLRLPTIIACSDLIILMNTHRLHTLSIVITDGVLPWEVEELFDLLYKHRTGPTLQVVDISFQPTTSSYWDVPDEPFVFEHLESVLYFRNMRIFRFIVPFFYKLGDEEIECIADAWPLLIQCRIGGRWGFTCESFITWSGLAQLVSKCPNLVELGISFDPRQDDMSSVTERNDFRPNHNLRYLNVQDSDLHSVEVFARQLFIIAPRIMTVLGRGPDDRDLDVIDISTGPHAFLEQVETMMWELRRTEMRDEFAFLDQFGECLRAVYHLGIFLMSSILPSLHRSRLHE